MFNSPSSLPSDDAALLRSAGGARALSRFTIAIMALMMLGIGIVRPASAQVAPPESILPLQIDEVVVRDGQLVALGSLGDTTFETPLNLTLDQIIDDPGTDVCAILDLEVGAIHLDLLGLNVDTSDICLLIAAEPGEGQLLGNLLCGIAGLLDGGLSLEDILAGLDPADLQDLLDQLRDLLNGALGEITSPASIAGVSDSGAPRGQGQPPNRGQGRVCDILNLSLGPVELDLLGLQVFLDDCNDGPVTVDITAERGRGNLLGNLLCSLAGLLDDPAADVDRISRLLNRILDAILRLT